MSKHIEAVLKRVGTDADKTTYALHITDQTGIDVVAPHRFKMTPKELRPYNLLKKRRKDGWIMLRCDCAECFRDWKILYVLGTDECSNVIDLSTEDAKRAASMIDQFNKENGTFTKATVIEGINDVPKKKSAKKETVKVKPCIEVEITTDDHKMYHATIVRQEGIPATPVTAFTFNNWRILSTRPSIDMANKSLGIRGPDRTFDYAYITVEGCVHLSKLHVQAIKSLVDAFNAHHDNGVPPTKITYTGKNPSVDTPTGEQDDAEYEGKREVKPISYPFNVRLCTLPIHNKQLPSTRLLNGLETLFTDELPNRLVWEIDGHCLHLVRTPKES